MKRKIAALLMASALTAALITACGSGGEETSGESAEETTAEETSGEESEEASDVVIPCVFLRHFVLSAGFVVRRVFTIVRTFGMKFFR